jgi:hypothetical protein
MLRLRDSQLDQIFRAARPLHVRDRDAFLQMIADRLRDCPEPGDGQVFQVVRELQRRFMMAPPDVPRSAPRWSSRRRNGVRQTRQSSAGAE